MVTEIIFLLSCFNKQFYCKVLLYMEIIFNAVHRDSWPINNNNIFIFWWAIALSWDFTICSAHYNLQFPSVQSGHTIVVSVQQEVGHLPHFLQSVCTNCCRKWQLHLNKARPCTLKTNTSSLSGAGSLLLTAQPWDKRLPLLAPKSRASHAVTEILIDPIRHLNVRRIPMVPGEHLFTRHSSLAHICQAAVW